jgi:hypothetical protein
MEGKTDPRLQFARGVKSVEILGDKDAGHERIDMKIG